MIIKGKDAKKYEYIIDTFKGVCELNNYSLVKVPIQNSEGVMRTSEIDAVLDLKGSSEKLYFYGPVMNTKETIELGAVSNCASDYRDAEMINMAVKFLYNLGLIDVRVEISNASKELIENLECLDITVISNENIDLKGNDLAYIVFIDDDKVINGYSNSEVSYFITDYDVLASKDDYLIEEITLDAYIRPLSKDVESDAFIIASNLKDAGFKVDVDYTLKNKEVECTYLITFDTNDIEHYQVKMTDTKTKEEKVVDIDTIIELLAFM